MNLKPLSGKDLVQEVRLLVDAPMEAIEMTVILSEEEEIQVLSLT